MEVAVQLVHPASQHELLLQQNAEVARMQRLGICSFSSQLVRLPRELLLVLPPRLWRPLL